MKKLILINLILAMILCIIPKDAKKIEVAAVNETVLNGVEQLQTVTNRSLTETRQEQTPNEIKKSIATGISQEGIDLIKRFERL